MKEEFHMDEMNNNYSTNTTNQTDIYDVAYTPVSNPPKKKKKRRFLKTIAFMVLFTFLAGTFYGAGYITSSFISSSVFPGFTNVASDEATLASTNSNLSIEQIQPIVSSTEYTDSAPVVIAETVGPSVVTVVTSYEQNSYSYFGSSFYAEGTGSGVIFDTDDNYLLIVTNYHVIEDADTIQIITSSNDTIEDVEVWGYDSVNDIALLAIDTNNLDSDILDSVNIATFGDSDDLQVGELAVAIGSPLGLEFSNTVTVGIISALDRSIDVDGYSQSLIQTDAAINPGNSGGALVNENGEIIGINSAKYVDEDIEGMGFAIAINDVIPIIDTILEDKSGQDIATTTALSDDRPFLGVGVVNVSDIYYETDMPYGVYISEVYENSGAMEAGIMVGDIIFSIDGERILDITDLTTAITAHELSDTIDIKLARGNEIIEVKATLYSYKDTVNNNTYN
jgi:serine protease Do